MLEQLQPCTLLRERARVSLNANEGVKRDRTHRETRSKKQLSSETGHQLLMESFKRSVIIIPQANNEASAFLFWVFH